MQANVIAKAALVTQKSKNPRESRRLKRAVAFAMTAVSVVAYERLLTASASAQNLTLTATDTGGTSSFSGASHWSAGPGGIPPANAAPTAGYNYEDQGLTGKDLIRIITTATFAGQSLQLDPDAYILFKGAYTATAPWIFNGGIIEDGGNSGGTVAGTVLLNGSSTSYVSARATSTTIAVSANISGTGNLIINNEDANAGGYSGQGTQSFTTGIVTFSGSNSYTGTTNISQGTLDLSLASGTDTYTGAFLGTGTLGIIGSGTVVFNAANTFSGSANITGGTLQLNNGSSLQNATVNLSGGTLAFNGGIGNFTFGSLAGNGSLALADTSSNPVALTVGNTISSAFSGSLTGAGSLTKVGSGQLTLSGANSYTGPTNINAGGILLSGSLTGTAVNVNSGAYLSGTTGGTVGGNVTVVPGGAIDFSKDGAATSAQMLAVGSLNLSTGSSASSAANLTYNVQSGGTADTIASSGPLTLGSSGQVFINLGGSYTAGTYTLLTYSSQIGQAPAGTYANGTANEPFVIGTGFPGAFTYSFNDTSTALTLQVNFVPSVAYWYGAYAGGNTGTFGGHNAGSTLTNFSNNSSGTVDFGSIPSGGTDVVFTASNGGSGGASLSGANINASLDANYAVNSLTVNSTPASTTLGGTGNLTIDGGIGALYASGGTGILVMSGAGPLTISTTGSVLVGSSQSWTNASSSPINISSGVTAAVNPETLSLVAAGSGNITLGGPVTGTTNALSLNINSSGSGIVVLGGNDSYTGTTQIVTGALQIGATGNVNTSGAVTVGASASPASLTIAGGTLSDSGGLVLGSAANETTALNISGGTLNYSGTGIIQFGYFSGTTTNVTLTSGVFNSSSTAIIYVANANASGGILNANVNLSNNAVFNAPASIFVLGQSGDGTTATNVSTATLTISGTAAFNVSSITVGCYNLGYYDNGIINLNGGTITTGSIVKGLSLVASSATGEVLNANGGTVQATGNSTGFLTGIYVNLGAGGLNFNTAGFTDNIPLSMSGVGGLTKIGTGILSVSGSSTYTGATTINAGTLAVGNGSATGSLPLASQIIDNSTLAFNRSNAAVQGVDFGVIGGTGGVLQTGLGISELSLANTYSGTTNISSGVLEFANAGALYSGNSASWTPANILISPGAGLGVYLGTGGFSAANAATFIGQLESNGVFTPGASLGLDAGSGSATYSSVIADSSTGPLGLIKVGTGTVTLTATNTYTGGTNITNGTLAMGNTLVFGPANSAVTVTGSGLIGIPSDSYFADAKFNLSNYAVNYSSGLGISFQNYTSALNIAGFPTIRLGAATGAPSGLTGYITGATTSLSYFGPGQLTLSGAVQSAALNVRQATLILSGPAATVNATAASAVGLNDGDNGNLILQNGAIFTSTSELDISAGSGPIGNTGVVTVADSSSGINVASLYVGKGSATQTVNNNVGTLNQLGGTVNVSSALAIGSYGIGTYNLAGGTLNLGTASTFNFGTSVGAVSTLNITGNAALNDAEVVNGNTGIIYVGNTGGAGASEVINISGNGAFNAPNAQVALGQSAGGSNINVSSITLNMSGNATFTTSKITFGGINNAYYEAPVINLNGGTIITGSITRQAINAAYLTSPTVAAINANGGTIQASAASTGFFNGDYLNLQAGGLNFNTAGFAVTNNTAMSGAGGFTKLGLGLFTQFGANTYSGPTNISGGALLIANDGALPTGNNVVVGKASVLVAADQGVVNEASSINMNGSMIIYSGDLGATTALAKTGFNNGHWNGAGIFSSAAAADTSHLTAVGVIVNDDGTGTGTALYPSTFEGQSTIDGDILVKYTYYGDTNLDGKVDGSDYSRIDSAFLANQGAPGSLTGWFNGDFNYDGVINGSDYTLIDNAFNTQGAAIASEIGSPTAEIAGSGTTSAVPEPATVGLLGAGLLGMLSRRRRRK